MAGPFRVLIVSLVSNIGASQECMQASRYARPDVNNTTQSPQLEAYT
jgi:hypothetical protein